MSDLAEAYKHIEFFYNGTDPRQREVAQSWLQEFSHSINAWTVCDRILSERKSTLTCCFAAQTIRQKILKDLKELPENSYLSLRESLIDHIGYFHSAAADGQVESIVTQLCLSIADLYIQVPQWTNWIVEFLQRCTTLQGDRTKMMLTLLKVFPEEIQGIRVGENRRRIIQEELAASATPVIQYLTEVLQHNPNEDIVRRIYDCLAAYVNNPAISSDSLASSALLETAFQIVSMPNVPSALHDSVTECIVQATLLAENQDSHLALAKALQKSIFNLAEPFNVAVGLEDFEKLQNFARLFIELTETLLEKIVNETSNNMDDLGSLYCLELLLLLAGHHDYSLIERTFNVWYRISEALFVIESDEHLAKFNPYVTRYVSALYRHSRFDTDEDSVPDEHSEFVDFRAKVTETIRDVVYIIGTDTAVRTMCDILTSCGSSNGTWDEMEAALFIIGSVVHNLLPEEDSVLPQLMTSITNLPGNSHPALIVSSIKLMAGCNEWLSKHAEFIDIVIRWLGSLITTSTFAPFCAEAIGEISQKCNRLIVHHLPDLLSLIPALERHATHGKKIEKAVCELLKATTMMLPTLHVNEIQLRLGEVCKPIVERLHAIVNRVKTDPNNENDKRNDSWARLALDPILWLNRIAIIFKELTPWPRLSDVSVPAPWFEISNALFEVVGLTLEAYQQNLRISEYCCRAFRYLIRSLGMQSQVFVDPLLNQIFQIYPKYPHSCFLYLASILVDEYGELQDERGVLMRMLEVLSQHTFAFLMKDSDVHRTMRNHPASIDDFYRLADRYLDRCPSKLFVSPVIHSIVDCGVVALQLDHDEATSTVTKFFCNIFKQLTNARSMNYRDDGVIAAERLLQSKGGAIITSCLNSALFHVTRNLRRSMAEVICWVGKYDAQSQRKWLEAATAQLPRGGLAATEEQLVQFVNNVTEKPSQMTPRDVFGHIRDLIQLYS